MSTPWTMSRDSLSPQRGSPDSLPLHAALCFDDVSRSIALEETAKASKLTERLPRTGFVPLNSAVALKPA